MSKISNPGVIISITAAAALVANRFVGYDGNYAGVGANPAGVSIADVAIGEEVAVQVDGIAVVESAGAITAGARVKAAANGTVAAAPNDAGPPVTSDAFACGVALEAATGANQFIRVKLF